MNDAHPTYTVMGYFCNLSNHHKFRSLRVTLNIPRYKRPFKCDMIFCMIEHCILVNGQDMFEDTNLTVNPLQMNVYVERVLLNYRILKRYPDYYKQILKFI